ncbi:hypothetical protein [Solidesulfovibrio carbinolicus]|uniref:Uncharacterized protein n=1 Tax=Solidesulfovibrio carbinolicus TaxID=296842 RepID=A0A4V0YQT9_9BACT|nr:hypothetical protein [Solidesulfovibrio carbinolicus]QAZ67462.1 hypothetical protein C3Y92_09595 [Solidesulfovibrio carbinolicus]
MDTAHTIERFLAQYAAIAVIAAYFGWIILKRIKAIVSDAKQEQAEYEAKYGSLEGLSEIYKRQLAGEREPNFLDHLKIALLTYVDAFRTSTGKWGILTIRLVATGAGVALLFYVVANFVKAGV